MRLTLAGCLTLIPGLALADVELSSRIDRVMVFPDAALVTRVAPLDLQAGPSALVLRGLPAALDPNSIRVEGEGSATYTIGALDVRVTPGDAQPVIDAELEAKLKGLRNEYEGVQGRLSAVESKKAMIERYAQASPEKLSNEAKPLEVAQWASAWTAIGDGLAQVAEELRTLNARAADLKAQIGALERARPKPAQAGAPKRDILLSVEAPSRTSGELRVSYRVTGAGWSAFYDARLETGDGEAKPVLALIRRAQVVQRTGEDWQNVQLSTVRVNRGTAVPDLPPLQVSFLEPAIVSSPALAPSVVPNSPRSREALGAAQDLARGEGGAPENRPAQERQATMEAGAFQTTFHVPGRVTVPQDGTTKNFVLSQRSMVPTLTVKATPVVDETAYLEASFRNEDEAPLLPGEVALHRDGAYVGRARLKLVATGDTVDLAYGADDKIKITRVPLRRRESEASWIGQSRSEVSEFKTTVKNLHGQPIRITIVDRVPFSENAAITVEPLREITPPTDRQFQDKRGVMAWSGDYAPGEQKEIRFGYRLKWPAEKDIVFESKPLRPR
ncbi:MAG TPA: mucoidy inhibitor MuiA family protein [Microvirga sp.]|jgi:uncharacterized protein (TIGR02231 family)|nr:mucoidy inhibitor MuiA family protein [Microvirga sp.]